MSRTIATLSAMLLALPGAARAAEVCAMPSSDDDALPMSNALEHMSLPHAMPRLVEHGDRGLNVVALTFDACTTRDPNPYDERITRTLVETRTPATLFVGGAWAAEEWRQLQALAREPLFELGSHSWSHPHMVGASDERIRSELMRTQSEVFALTGRLPTLFRPPYGEYDEHLVREAARAGLTTVEFDLASGDPDDLHATRERLIARVLKLARPGSIVVMHINHRRFHTAEALPAIISGLRAKGFELVTVSEMLRRERAAEIALGNACSCWPSASVRLLEVVAPLVDSCLCEPAAAEDAALAAGPSMGAMLAVVADTDIRRRYPARRA